MYLYTFIIIDFDWDLSRIPRPKLRFVCWTLTLPSLSYKHVRDMWAAGCGDNYVEC